MFRVIIIALLVIFSISAVAAPVPTINPHHSSLALPEAPLPRRGEVKLTTLSLKEEGVLTIVFSSLTAAVVAAVAIRADGDYNATAAAVTIGSAAFAGVVFGAGIHFIRTLLIPPPKK